MIYQLRTNLFFHDMDAINDIKDKVLDHFADAMTINPDNINTEFSIIEIIENHHDENPNEQCILLYKRTNEP